MPREQIKDTDEGFPRGIGNPATQALNAAGFTRLNQLSRTTEAELMALHGFGLRALRILKAALEERGLALAPPVPKVKRKQTRE